MTQNIITIMKSKILTLFLLLVAGIGAAFAEKVQIGDLYYNLDANNQKAEVTYKSINNYNKYNVGWNISTVIIPSSITYNSVTYNVTSIGFSAFENCEELISVTIPNSVTSIGRYAFKGCTSLDSIIIPNSITSIGDYAFQYCRGLISMRIPDSVNSIGFWAFHACTGLTSVTLGNHIKAINESAFYYCSSLASVTIPDSVISIGKMAFYNCGELSSLIIGTSVKSIGERAFENCPKLTLVTMNSNEIVSKTYSSNSNIMDIFGSQVTNYIIGDSVTSIGERAFSGYNSLNSVTIGNNVISIGNYAFSGCSGLTSIELPNNVISIGQYAFSGCSGLTSIELPNSVTSIGQYAFTGCMGLNYPIYNAHLFAYMPRTFSGAYNVQDGIESIIDGAFDGCSGMTSVTIPNSVTIIGNSAFYGCSGLTSVTIPNSVTTIGNSAFDNCTGLTSVTIGNNVRSIGNNAFLISKISTINFTGTIHEWCQRLWSSTAISSNYDLQLSGESQQTITIPVDLDYMRGDAFNGCNVTSVTWNAKNCYLSSSSSSSYYGPFGGTVNSFVFGDEVERIPGSLCRGMQLSSVEIPNSVKEIGGYAFSGCSQLSSLTIGDSVTYIGSNAFADCGRLTSVDIPNRVYRIDDYAFWQCSGLQSVSFGNSVAQIGNYAFQGCSNLAAISLPNSVTSIGGYVFAGCVNLESIRLSPNITEIYQGVFFGCKKLALINIPKGITKIGDYAFNDCSALSSFEVGNSVTSIGYEAFKSCTNLSKLSLGENITTYGKNCFAGCSALTSIYNYRRTPVTLSADVFKNVDYFACTLYVLEGAVDMYRSERSSWKDFFYNIEPIAATPTATDNVQVTPADNTAIVVWPKVNGAETYELEIKDKLGSVVCALIFNAEGQLKSRAFNAPSSNEAPRQTQSAGFSFTVTGLNSGTNYDLVLTSKNDGGETIQTKIVSFTTTGEAQGVENILSENAHSTKIIRDGQVLIQKGDKTYTVTGVEVK